MEKTHQILQGTLTTPDVVTTPYARLHKGAGLLAKLAWKFLNFDDALEHFEYTVERWTFDQKAQGTITEAVHRALLDANVFIDDAANMAIIMGSPTLQRLVASPDFRQATHIGNLRWRSAARYYYNDVYDVPLYVVPGVEGFIVVPRDIFKR